MSKPESVSLYKAFRNFINNELGITGTINKEYINARVDEQVKKFTNHYMTTNSFDKVIIQEVARLLTEKSGIWSQDRLLQMRYGLEQWVKDEVSKQVRALVSQNLFIHIAYGRKTTAIENTKQYQVTKEKLKDFKEAISAGPAGDISPELRKIFYESNMAMVETLTRELIEFEIIHGYKSEV